MKPFVTVILPTFNRSEVLKIAIKSVLRQSFTDFELLVIGDCCTDESEEVVKSFNDDRIKWFNLEKNSGSQSEPNNFGNRIAQGEYIAYQSHDDLWKSNHLELLVTKNADLVHSLGLLITIHKKSIRKTLVGCYEGDYKEGICLCPNITMHRRNVWKDVGGWRNPGMISLPLDQDYFTRIFHAKKKFAKVDILNKKNIMIS
jgi:glycosyltransferase involved in cell wall biosynthesis